MKLCATILQTSLILLLAASALSACAGIQPIKVGFTAELSGRNATLGVQGRNGAQLAIDAINQNGGVAGRKLELLVRDDQASEEQVVKIDSELIDLGAVVLSGHMTSWETRAARSLYGQRGIILFSPTASSSEFDAQADNFFRLVPDNSQEAYPMAAYVIQKLHRTRAAIIHDQDNIAFTETFANGFARGFTELGGTVAVEEEFSSSQKPSFAQIVQRLRSSQADILVVIASGVDTALIVQQTRLQNWPVQVYTSLWAYTNDLLLNGGRSVEGILISSHFDDTCRDPDFLNFKSRYEKTYGQTPSFSAVFSYETMQVLASALEETQGKNTGLAQALTRIRDFKGLCDRISMNKNGDITRSLYIITVRGGAFEKLDSISPEPLQ